GAGNLLGDEQSGHVAAVGFEMYAQMLEEAVAELRGEHLAALTTVRLDVPVTAYVPPAYIAYEATKVDAHRRIARAATLGELGDVRAELADRFGAPPGPVENLLALQALRIKAGELGLRAVTLRGARLQLDGLDIDGGGIARLRAALPRAVYLAQRSVLTVHGDGAAPAAEDELNERSQALMWVEQVLDAILDARATADLSSDPGSQNS
ncbi:MAG: transcription-repair coupling factor, partial [Actinomycetota bacterium]